MLLNSQPQSHQILTNDDQMLILYLSYYITTVQMISKDTFDNFYKTPPLSNYCKVLWTASTLKNNRYGQYINNFSRLLVTYVSFNIYSLTNNATDFWDTQDLKPVKKAAKGQLISEAIFLGFTSPKKQTIFFEGFLP